MLSVPLFIICLGPICVPIYGLLPLLAIVWAWLRRKFGYGNDEEEGEKLDFSNENAFLKKTDGEAEEEESDGKNANASTSTQEEDENVDQSGLKRRKTASSALEEQYYTGKVLPLTGMGEFRAVVNNKKGVPVLVDFGATWCGPCKQIKPVFKQLAAANAGKAIFVSIDVDQAKEIADVHKVGGIPDFRVYVEGKERNGFKGANPNRLKNLLSTYVK